MIIIRILMIKMRMMIEEAKKIDKKNKAYPSLN